MLVRKDNDEPARDALVEFAQHIHSSYTNITIVLEPEVAQELHSHFSFPVYAASEGANPQYEDKVDLTSTFGGDGTILHAASLFATAKSVPPILSFSMGTLGFLGEWKYKEYKRAFREVYVSGAPSPLPGQTSDETATFDADAKDMSDWSAARGKTMGASRNSRILMRSRLRIGLFDADGKRLPHEPPFSHADNQC